MSLPPPPIIDVVTRVTPFGVRFSDAVTRRPIGDLNVTARPDFRPERLFTLFPNSSAVFVLKGLPGLRAFEFGKGDDEFWAHRPPPRSYRLTVIDPLRRYLPFTFPVEVPTRGLFQWMCGPQISPIGSGVADVPLFSAPSRPIPEGMVAVRADLCWWDTGSTEQPAAWALVEVSYAGKLLGLGMADEQGRALVLIAYPKPAGELLLGSPFDAGSTSWEQKWTLDFSVAFVPPLESPLAEDAPIPDLCQVMDQLEQPRAIAWSSSTRTTPLTQAVLKSGHELILRSVDAATGDPLSVLYITPVP